MNARARSLAAAIPEPLPRVHRPLLRYLTENQCSTCLGWAAGARRLAERTVGRRADIRPCVCGGGVCVPVGQGVLDFGDAA